MTQSAGQACQFGQNLAANFTATSSTTLATAMESLFLNPGVYAFRAVLNFSEATAGTGGIKFAIALGTTLAGSPTVTGTNTIGRHSGVVNGAAIGAAQFNVPTTGISFGTISTVSNSDVITWEGTFNVVGGTCSAVLQCAQNSSSANTTTLAAGSFWEITKMG